MHVCTCVYIYVKPVCIVFKLMHKSSNLLYRVVVPSTGAWPPPPHLFSCLQNIKRRCVFISIHQQFLEINWVFLKASSRHSVIMFENSPFSGICLIYIIDVGYNMESDIVPAVVVGFFTKCHNTENTCRQI